jgi:carbonic anhydrase
MTTDFVNGTLREGVARFRSVVFPRRRALFEQLAAAQEPQALFITCADSRVVPSLLTHTAPGDLFVERNPGNIVPIHAEHVAGESASIEYAVAVLHVPHIIVCGHSDCGAVKGMLHPEKVAAVPAVARWLRYGEDARARTLAALPDDADEDARVALLTRLNVVAQMAHLATHPSVRAAQDRGKLSIHGWVYTIETGEVEAWDPMRSTFLRWPD